MPLSNFLPYLAWGAPALAALAWAALALKGQKKDKTEDQDEDQGDTEYELPKLRTRPLNPSIDLSTYTYM